MKILLSLIILLTFNSVSFATNCHDGDHSAGHSHEDIKSTGLSSGTKSENIIDVAANGMVCDFCAQAIEKVKNSIKKFKKLALLKIINIV